MLRRRLAPESSRHASATIRHAVDMYSVALTISPRFQLHFPTPRHRLAVRSILFKTQAQAVTPFHGLTHRKRRMRASTISETWIFEVATDLRRWTCRVALQPAHYGWRMNTAVCRPRSLAARIRSGVPLPSCQAGAGVRHPALARKNNILGFKNIDGVTSESQPFPASAGGTLLLLG
jgi:hypothetical protein